MVALGNDGRITSQGSVADALAHNKALVEELKRDRKAVELDEKEGGDDAELDEVSGAKTSKLVVAEEIELGHVSRDASTCSK